MIRITETIYDPLTVQKAHAHDRTSVTLIMSGRLRERVGRHERLGAPLAVVVKPAYIEHSDEYGPEGVRALQLSMEPSVAAEGSPLSHWRWQDAGPALPAFLLLLRAFRSEASATRIENLAWEVIASLSSVAPAVGDAPTWLARVREAVDDGASHSVSALARGAGVHPVYLARMFRRHYGCSVSARVLQLRLQRTADLLARADQRVSVVAYEAGFYDHAQMCRLFRRSTGIAPSQYRELLAGAR